MLNTFIMSLAGQEQVLTNVFSALSHPLRRKLLEHLKQGKATVSELAKPFEVSMPAITRHLKILEEAKLITRDRDAQKRYSQLDAGSMKIAAHWLLDYRSYWQDHMDRLEQYVKQNNEHTANKDSEEDII